MEPDGYLVRVEEDTIQSVDLYQMVVLTDENGNQLVDETGRRLVAPNLIGVSNVYTVQVEPDDFSIIVEED